MRSNAWHERGTGTRRDLCRRVVKVGRVSLLAYCRPGDLATAARAGNTNASYAMRSVRLRAVMLDRLGPFVWHDDPTSAAAILEEGETARLAVLAGRGVAPLEAVQVDELRGTFGAH